jgi:hypothetical protein
MQTDRFVFIGFKFYKLIYKGCLSFFVFFFCINTISSNGMKLNIHWLAVATSEIWLFPHHKMKIDHVCIEKPCIFC